MHYVHSPHLRYSQLAMHILLHVQTVYKDFEDILAIQGLHLKGKKKAIAQNIETICFIQPTLRKILKISIKRNILILGKKISQNKDYRASCLPYIHVKKYLRTLHSECPSRCSNLNSYFSIDLGMLLTLNTLFAQNAFLFYIIMLFDKTGNCAVQENIKIYFKLG